QLPREFVGSFVKVNCCAGLRTVASESEIKKVEEQDVILPCRHRFDHSVSGNLDIEWLLQDSEPGQKVVITYSGRTVYNNVSDKQKGRVSFAADYLTGDASIKITSLQSTDSGLYTCKVKNEGVYDLKSPINLIVLVKPSKPKCRIQGKLLQGNDIKLQCKSEKGTNPIQYRWEWVSDANGHQAKFPSSSHIDSSIPEVLMMKNLSQESTGLYRCIAFNEAGEDSCHIRVTIMQVKDSGVVAGAIIGVIVGLLLIFFIVWFMLQTKKKHKHEEVEIPNEIREDAEAPKVKLVNTHSSSGTGSTLSGSCSVKSIRNDSTYYQQPRTVTLSADEVRPHIAYAQVPAKEATSNQNGPSHANIKRMGAVPVMIPAQTRAFQTV
uniref:CXADR-like membrane protein n=1 Tax=Callorhinchus milii TaxID=7868 RepID=A0A4W3HBK0_CALMI